MRLMTIIKFQLYLVVLQARNKNFLTVAFITKQFLVSRKTFGKTHEDSFVNFHEFSRISMILNEFGKIEVYLSFHENCDWAK